MRSSVRPSSRGPRGDREMNPAIIGIGIYGIEEFSGWIRCGQVWAKVRSKQKMKMENRSCFEYRFCVILAKGTGATSLDRFLEMGKLSRISISGCWAD